MPSRNPSPPSPSLAAYRLHALTISKLSKSDHKAALKYAICAQEVDSTLPHLPLIITALKVLLSPPGDHYQTLLLPPFSSSSQIRSQFKSLSLTFRSPDLKFDGIEEAVARIEDSYRVLSNRELKKEFDDSLSSLETEKDDVGDLVPLQVLVHKKDGVSKSKAKGKRKSDDEDDDYEEEEEEDGGVMLVMKKDKNKKKLADENFESEDEEDTNLRSRPKRNRVRKSYSDDDYVYKEEGKNVEPRSSRKAKVGKEKTLAQMQLVPQKNGVSKSKTKGKKKSDDEDDDYEEEEEGEEEDEGNLLVLKKDKNKKRLANENSESEEEEEDTNHISRSKRIRVRKSYSDEEYKYKEEGNNVEPRSSRKVKVGKEKTLAQMQMEIFHAKKRNKKAIFAIDDEEEDDDMSLMKVVDSDFYDFDMGRREKSFVKGQIWAVYDGDDGMPRHYGLVEDVKTINPFKVKIRWLEIDSKREKSLVPFENSVHYGTCGKYKVGSKVDICCVNMFSHLVQSERVGKEIYRIYPRKGSVWALYKDVVEEDEVGRGYDIVVCLTSYSEMYGLSVAYLEKVDGYKTIFKRKAIGVHAITWLEKVNGHMFSHQIPARKLLDEEDENLPRECWELDPASLPSELLCISRGD